jgi:hypothetical protein
MVGKGEGGGIMARAGTLMSLGQLSEGYCGAFRVAIAFAAPRWALGTQVRAWM